jgi:hypothetical protein
LSVVISNICVIILIVWLISRFPIFNLLYYT